MKKYFVSPPNYISLCKEHYQLCKFIFDVLNSHAKLKEKIDRIESFIYIFHISLIIITPILYLFVNHIFSGLLTFVLLYMFSEKYNRALLALFSSYIEMISIKHSYQYINAQLSTLEFQDNHLNFIDNIMLHNLYHSKSTQYLSHIKNIIGICFKEGNKEKIQTQLISDIKYLIDNYNSAILKNNKSYCSTIHYKILPLNKNLDL